MAFLLAESILTTSTVALGELYRYGQLLVPVENPIVEPVMSWVEEKMSLPTRYGILISEILVRIDVEV
jgi:hypothetical protein